MTATSYTATTKAYYAQGVPCEDDTSVTEIEGVTLGLVLGQGDVSDTLGCVDSETRGDCAGGELPVDLGLPGLSLKTGDGGSVSGKVGWALDVKIGHESQHAASTSTPRTRTSSRSAPP